MFLSLSILILIVQPYKKSYMNVLDGLLLALLGLVTLLLVTFQYLHNTIKDGKEVLALILVIICSFPQLILLLSAIYRQMKRKRIVQYIARHIAKASSYAHKTTLQINYQMKIHCPIHVLVLISAKGLCAHMVQSAREMDL